MKKNLLLFSFIIINHFSYSQCQNSTLYDGVEIPVGIDINDGEEHQIAQGIEAGEYVIISGISATDKYRFTSNRTDTNNPNLDYITIRDDSNPTTVLGSSFSPLEIDPINASSIQIHINLNASCDTDTEFHDLTIQNLSQASCNMPGAPGGITYKSDTRIDFYWSSPELSNPAGYDWRIVLAGGDVDSNIIASGSTIAPNTNASTGEDVLSSGTSYWIYVRSTCPGDLASSWFKFPPTYVTNAAEPPENDLCEGATTIVQELNKMNIDEVTAISGTLEGGAGTNLDAETCNTKTGNSRDDVWYKFIAQTDDININLDPTFDAVLTLYSGNCGSLNYIICSDDPSVVLADEEIFASSSNGTGLNIGETYYLRVYYLGTTTPVNPTYDLKIWSSVDVTDTDNDGYSDIVDNCPTMSNPSQEDSDGNGTGDICESLSNEEFSQTDLKLFPNPFDDKFIVYLPATYAKDNNLLEIFDLKGVLIKSLIINEETIIEIKGLNRIQGGLYLVKISNKTKDKIAIKRIIKL